MQGLLSILVIVLWAYLQHRLCCGFRFESSWFDSRLAKMSFGTTNCTRGTHPQPSISTYKKVHVEKGFFFLNIVNGHTNNYSHLQQLIGVELFTTTRVVRSCKIFLIVLLCLQTAINQVKATIGGFSSSYITSWQVFSADYIKFVLLQHFTLQDKFSNRICKKIC